MMQLYLLLEARFSVFNGRVFESSRESRESKRVKESQRESKEPQKRRVLYYGGFIRPGIAYGKKT